MKALIRNLRGILVFAGLTINTLFWFVPLILLALLKLLPIPPLQRVITQLLMGIAENWISINSWIFAHGGSIDWQARGVENLSKDNWYLVIPNHQTWVDILVLQKVFNRRIPLLKFFIKQQLIWFPVMGIAWWALDMPFMKRYSPSYITKHPEKKGKDLETTRKACEKFRTTPTSVINFIEGTRFSAEKRESRNSPYRHLLAPRAGGLAVAMSSMGKLFNSILDVTLVYPDGPAGFWELCCGTHVRVLVDVRERPVEPRLAEGDYQNDREFRRFVHSWLNDMWAEKDARIPALHAQMR
ncbi:MAG: acyltransferase [Woeseiaceae bacterium]|nr:acyltransferase [Woeseiaceae bacterium]